MIWFLIIPSFKTECFGENQNPIIQIFFLTDWTDWTDRSDFISLCNRKRKKGYESVKLF